MKKLLSLATALAVVGLAGYFFFFNYNLLPPQLQKPQTPRGEIAEKIARLEEEKARLNQVNQLLKEELQRFTGLVPIHQVDNTIVLDLRYATADNFTGQPIYPVAVALLRQETAAKLARVNKELDLQGYRIKVWDAYRPPAVQQILWDLVQDRRYVAPPDNGSRHNRGAAVDVTLVDLAGNELIMPTGFDDFTEVASRSYPDIPAAARRNMELLTEAMVRNGFTIIENEWWHFDDSDWANYPLVDVSLEAFQ